MPSSFKIKSSGIGDVSSLFILFSVLTGALQESSPKDANVNPAIDPLAIERVEVLRGPPSTYKFIVITIHQLHGAKDVTPAVGKVKHSTISIEPHPRAVGRVEGTGKSRGP
ncbi:MAG: hypothetical protein ABI760_26160, partial [Ferruginibacter sp.]